MTTTTGDEIPEVKALKDALLKIADALESAFDLINAINATRPIDRPMNPTDAQKMATARKAVEEAKELLRKRTVIHL
jgi:hypothetical protein